jgi:hypothetical protein
LISTDPESLQVQFFLLDRLHHLKDSHSLLFFFHPFKLLYFKCAVSVPAASQPMVCSFPHHYFHGSSISTAWSCSISWCTHVGSFVPTSGTIFFMHNSGNSMVHAYVCILFVFVPTSGTFFVMHSSEAYIY